MLSQYKNKQEVMCEHECTICHETNRPEESIKNCPVVHNCRHCGKAFETINKHHTINENYKQIIAKKRKLSESEEDTTTVKANKTDESESFNKLLEWVGKIKQKIALVEQKITFEGTNEMRKQIKVLKVNNLINNFFHANRLQIKRIFI